MINPPLREMTELRILHHVLFLFVAPLLDLTHKIMYNKLINYIFILYIKTVFLYVYENICPPPTRYFR